MPQNTDNPKRQPLVARATVATVEFARRFAWPVVALSAALIVLLAVFASGHLSFNTDTTNMLSADLPFRKANIAYRALFPDYRDPILIVIDGADPDVTDQGARALAERLAAKPDMFLTVRYAPSDPFFRKNGLLYLATDKLAALSDNIAQNQAFLASLANDPSLRGLFELLRKAVDEGAGEIDRQEGMRRGIDAIAATIEGATKGKASPLSWSTLIDSGTVDAPKRREILVETAVDQANLNLAANAARFIRDAATALNLTPEHGVRVRLTGEAALQTDELASVFSGASLASGLSFLLVAVIVLLGLRSIRLVASVILTLMAGLVCTSAFAAGAVGSLNLISVAFAVLFIGIAVDFGIHFSLRYKEQTLAAVSHDAALRHAAARVGPSLVLAGLAALIAFFSFLPTSYRGLAELGLIAGAGMVVAVVTSLTLLPALLTVLPKSRATGPAVAPRAAAIEAFVRRHARAICMGALALGLVALWFAAEIRFEANPLNLQDPRMESVAALRELMREEPAARPSISIIAPDLATAQKDAERLKTLPSVAEVATAADYIPSSQDRKLQIIDDMSLFLAPLLDPRARASPPDAAGRRAVMGAFLDAAKRYLNGNASSPIAPSIRQLADATAAFLAGPGKTDDGLARLESALLSGLAPRLADLAEALKAKPVALADLPDWLRRSYIAPDGQARVEVRPKEDLTDEAALGRFVREVTAAFPNAVGPPIQLVASSQEVLAAFYQASATALILIIILLLVVLRSIVDTAYVLAPLALAGTLAFAISAIAGLPINFANIIVLPLLLGLGVSSGIYLVTRAREEPGRALLQTITPRAVVFSALTTIASFGSLAVSGHLGMASMGWLLLIAISLSLVCTMVVLPALLVLRYQGGGESRKTDSSR